MSFNHVSSCPINVDIDESTPQDPSPPTGNTSEESNEVSLSSSTLVDMVPSSSDTSTCTHLHESNQEKEYHTVSTDPSRMEVTCPQNENCDGFKTTLATTISRVLKDEVIVREFDDLRSTLKEAKKTKHQRQNLQEGIAKYKTAVSCWPKGLNWMIPLSILNISTS